MKYRELAASCALLLIGITFSQTADSQVKKPPANQTKGQSQLAGGVGQFGTIYSLKGGFNFTILSAKYTLEPFIAYSPIRADDGQKLFVMDIAIKNASPSNNFFNEEGVFTVVDQTGALFNGHTALQSAGTKSWNSTLKPGQGQGQASLHDPLQVGFKVPDASRIVKVIINLPMLLVKSDVIRYYIAGATKEEAGDAGNPKNVVSPLAAYGRDTKDSSGAIALDEINGTMGTYLPSGFFDLRLDSFVFSSDPVKGNNPPDGKRYAIATVTAKYLSSEARTTMFHVSGGDFPQHQLTDSEGERSKPIEYLHAKRDENAAHEFQLGDEYTFKLVFVLPKDDTAKKLVIGTGGCHKIAYDISAVK